MSAPLGDLVLLSWLKFVPSSYSYRTWTDSWCSVHLVASFPVDRELLKVRVYPSLILVSVGYRPVPDSGAFGDEWDGGGQADRQEENKRFWTAVPRGGVGSTDWLLRLTWRNSANKAKENPHTFPPFWDSVHGRGPGKDGFTLKLMKLKLQDPLPSQPLPGSWELQQFLILNFIFLKKCPPFGMSSGPTKPGPTSGHKIWGFNKLVMWFQYTRRVGDHLLLNVWFTDQNHQHRGWVCLKCRISALPSDPLYLNPHFHKTSGLIHMKNITFNVKSVKCCSSSFPERKIISGCEIREAFLEEMISERDPRVEAVFGCKEVYSSRGSSIRRLTQMGSIRTSTSTPGPFGWNWTRTMVVKLSGVGMREAGRPWRHTSAG